MKKLVVLILAVSAFTSCITIRSSATHKSVEIQPIGALIADLQVAPERVSYTMKPHRRVRRGGFENVKSTAIREALKSNGGGDVLVGLEVQTKQSGFLWWRKIKSITVSGYPAKYTNFTSPSKDYWTPEAVWLTQDAINKVHNRRRGVADLQDFIELTKKHK